MKRSIFLILCFVQVGISAFSQKKRNREVTGIVLDSLSMAPLAAVSIRLVTARNDSIIDVTYSKENGQFSLKDLNLSSQNSTLYFSRLGYDSKSLNANKFYKDNKKAVVYNVLLSPKKNRLKGITITATKPIIRQDIDKITYNVQADPASKGLSAIEIFRKVPYVSIDVSDNIKLKGSSSYLILINGHPSSLVASNPGEFFKSMPASSIKKIEVITVPPAKYDAEGLTGIINVITKRTDEGFKANFNASYNSVYGPGANISLSAKKGKFGIALMAGDNLHIKQTTAFNSKRKTYLNSFTELKQEGNQSKKTNYKYSGIEITYQLDSLNLLTADIDYNYYNSDGIINQSSVLLDKAMTLSQSYHVKSLMETINDGTDFGLNYQRGFRKNNKEFLTLSYKYSNTYNKEDNITNISKRINYGQMDYMQSNNAGNDENTVQVDYIEPMKHITFEIGAKSIFRNNYSDFSTNIFDTTSKQYEVDSSQSNYYHYRQNIYSLYNSWELKLTKWGFKGGLRLENTHNNAHFAYQQSGFNNNYINVIPSLTIQRLLSANSSLNIGYTDRIERPSIWQLNPFSEKLSPKYYTKGNKDLKPSLNHVFDISYSKFNKGYFIIGLSYQFVNNSIQSITTFNEQDSVSTSTYKNIGKSKTITSNLNFNIPLGKVVSLNSNLQFSYIILKGKVADQDYANEGFKTNVSSGLDFAFKSGWRTGVFGGYDGRDLTLQGKNSDYYYVSANIAKDFLNKKLSISGYISNPQKKFFDANTYIHGPGYQQTNSSQKSYRSIGISINYKLGKTKMKIQKNSKGIENSDVDNGRKVLRN